MSNEEGEIVLDDDGIIKMPEINFEPNPNGLGDEMFRAMKKNGHRTAQIRPSDGFSETYTALLTRCIRTALEMQHRMVTYTDIICLCTYNHTNSCVPFIASLFIGATVASLDPSQSANDIAYLLNIVKPKMIFVVPEALDLIVSALEEASMAVDLVVFGESEEHTPFSVFLEEKGEEVEENFEPVKVTSNQETAVVFFSSGTTGYPKGICVSHYALVMQGTAMVKSGVTSSVILVYSSLYWISAAAFLTSATIAGSARVICSSFDSEKIWRYIDNYRVSLLFLAPVQAIEMANAGRPDLINTTSLLDLLCGGGILPLKHILLLRDLLPGTNIAQVYGQTEIAGAITIFSSKKRKDVLLAYYKPESCGRPIRGIWYKIVDPETEQLLAFNERGELRVKTKCQMNGYYGMDSSSSWDDDGFIKTGDIAYFDEDFCFYIVDRIKELLKFRSWHVVPAVLEHILLQHPAVKEAIVLGVPHEVDGDHALGVVVLKEDVVVSAEELESFVGERVDDRQRLRAGVKIVEKLYYTPTGKVRRKYMRDLLLSGELQD